MKTLTTVAAVLGLLAFTGTNAQTPPKEIDGFVLVMNDSTGIHYVSKERTTSTGGLVEFETLGILKQPIALPGGTAVALNGRQLLDCARKTTRSTTINMLSSSGDVISSTEIAKVIGVKWEPLKPGSVPFHAAKLHCGAR